MFAGGRVEIADRLNRPGRRNAGVSGSVYGGYRIPHKSRDAPNSNAHWRPEQSEPWHVNAGHGNIPGHVIVFAMIHGNISRKIVVHRIAAHDGCAFPPTVKANMTPVLMNVIPMPPVP